ncbi:MAG: MFS transporter [Actinomycetia bacterium]|nr:MFS transporter [Actinomycetes bacterium]MCP4959522.1 MFS transporter [Actinomycetes bacterium]
MDDVVDGPKAWLIACAAAVSTFAVFGVAYSFGAFFGEMSDEFGTGSSATAFIFSLTISASFFFGLFTGRWADRVGPRPVLITAAISLSTGLILTSRVDSIWLGYLTYGLLVGFAVACGYVPMVATVGGWFVRRRATALGISVAGIGLGTLVGARLAAPLIDEIGWRDTYVVFGIVGGLLLLGVAAVAQKGPAAPASAPPKSVKELAANSDFRLLYMSTLTTTFGLFIPFVFIADYASDRGASDGSAALLIGLIGGASVVGRLAVGGFADRFGPTGLYVGSFIAMAFGHTIWLTAGDRYSQLVVYALVLGTGYGGFIALSPAVVAQRMGLEGLGGVLGTLYTAAAVGSLFGPPIAGQLIDSLGYSWAIGFAAAMAAFGAVFLIPFVRAEPA